MSKKLMISCDEATAICDKNQYGEASRWDKLRLQLHLFLCKHCKEYSKQNFLMSKILGKHSLGCDGSHHLSETEMENLKEKLKDRLIQ